MLCHYAECHYAECSVLFIIMLNVIMLCVVMLSVVAPFLRRPWVDVDRRNVFVDFYVQIKLIVADHSWKRTKGPELYTAAIYEWA